MKNKKLLVSAMLVSSMSTVVNPTIYATSVNDIQSQVDEANNTINETQSEIDSANEQISALSSEIDSIEADLNAKRNEITSNQESINKINAELENTKTEINQLEERLSENVEQSNDILSTLQKNSNVNYFFTVAGDNDIDTLNKINIAHGMNKLAQGSYDVIEQTMELEEEISAKQSELNTAQANLETQQQTLADESASLVSESQEAEQKKMDLAKQITELNSTSAAQKEELLASADLLDQYQNAGCSGDDVYGVDCAVPTPEPVIEEQEAAQDEVVEPVVVEAEEPVVEEVVEEEPVVEEPTVDETETTTEDNTDSSNTTDSNTETDTGTDTSGSYVAKLKADPDANYIINKESGWNPYATNPTSGAYGICQALPGSKMASAGSDWATNIETQAKWCDSYVMGRYGSWSAARSFWDENNWF